MNDDIDLPMVPVLNCAVLSAHALIAKGILKANYADPEGSPWYMPGNPSWTIKCLSATIGSTDGYLAILDANTKKENFRINLVTTPRLPYGGLQWWFLCPVQSSKCLGRVAKLYRRPSWLQEFRHGRNPNACRHCNAIYYPSSRAPRPPPQSN